MVFVFANYYVHLHLALLTSDHTYYDDGWLDGELNVLVELLLVGSNRLFGEILLFSLKKVFNFSRFSIRFFPFFFPLISFVLKLYQVWKILCFLSRKICSKEKKCQVSKGNLFVYFLFFTWNQLIEELFENSILSPFFCPSLPGL